MQFFMNSPRQGFMNAAVPQQNPMQYATAPISQAQIMANVPQRPDPIRSILNGLYAQQQPDPNAFQNTGNTIADIVNASTYNQRQQEQADQSKMADYLRRFSNG